MLFKVKKNQNRKTKTKSKNASSVLSKYSEVSRFSKKNAPVFKPPSHSLAPRLGWKIHSRKYLVWDRFMNVRQDDVSIGRRRFRYTYLDHPGAVFAIGITPKQEIVLIRLFRYPLDQWCWEIPSGGLGDKPGKSPLRVAKDELLEEAGGKAKKWTSLGWFWSANGVARLKLYFFLAEGVELVRSSPEESEQISDIVKVPLHRIKAHLRKGKVKDGDSVLAIHLALQHLRSRKSQGRIRDPEGLFLD